MHSPYDDPFRPIHLSSRTHCPACGHKKAKRWGEGRASLTKFCPNESCIRFGVPMLVSVQKVVTIDRLGRPHVRHKEIAIRRQPGFDVTLGAIEGGASDAGVEAS